MAAKPFTLAYIGVGLMGGPMSQRLAKLGWQVTAYDIAPERLEAARTAGIKTAGSAAEAADARAKTAATTRQMRISHSLAAKC